MSGQTITLRLVKSLKSTGREYTVWDDALKGFGVRVRASGAMVYVVVYRAGSGRGAPVRRYTIAAVGKIAPEAARGRAKMILGSVAHGSDPAADKTTGRNTLTVAELGERFMAEHVAVKRKAGTLKFYGDILDRIVKPEIGANKADKLTRLQVGRLHASLSATPFQANRVLAMIGSMYGYGTRAAMIPEGMNPARGIEKFRESRRERFLTTAELERLGNSIREAESNGIPWNIDRSKVTAKHAPKAALTKINPIATAALRLLLFTGCRVGEILSLRWDFVDVERGLLLLPDSKSGRKTIVLNAPAMTVLASLPKVGPFVVPGDDPSKPRTDLKRPWKAVTQHAGLIGVRLHDLRHTYASYGAGGGLGLPIIGRLLGHAHVSTTARYAHLDSDPLKQASEAIASRIAAAFEGHLSPTVVNLRNSTRRPAAV
jgi:integrase